MIISNDWRKPGFWAENLYMVHSVQPICAPFAPDITDHRASGQACLYQSYIWIYIFQILHIDNGVCPGLQTDEDNARSPGAFEGSTLWPSGLLQWRISLQNSYWTQISRNLVSP